MLLAHGMQDFRGVRTICFGILHKNAKAITYQPFPIALAYKKGKRKMAFVIPVNFAYNGRKYDGVMGPFEHSAEREFSLTVSKKAIMECGDREKLREVSLNLLQAWSSMQTAFQSLMLENINLRQAMDSQHSDLEAAEKLLSEMSNVIDEQQCELQSKKARMSLWPW